MDDRAEPEAVTRRRRAMTARLRPGASCLIVLSMLAVLLAGCASAVSPSPSPSPGGSPLTEPGAKEVLLARFGPLVYCDPDFYPVARKDEASAAAEHLAEMRADSAAWTAITARLGLDPATAPVGNALLAAYREWKMVRAIALAASGSGWSFDALFGSEAKASVTHVVGTIGADGTIHVDRQEASGPPPCPICLARGTKIATPRGEVAVEALRTGDPIWTLDGLGRRVRAVVTQVGSTPVPADHEVVRLALADGRTVLVSPGHPLLGGRPVGALQAGDAYDGSVVASADRIPYDGGRTFDVLPSGRTGVYWANGIELGSTLFR